MEQSDLSTMLAGVMSNPEIMSKLQGILSDPEAQKSLSSVIPQREQSAPAPSLPLPKQSEEARNRARLISALKPYLNEDRRNKADKLMGLLSILELTGSANIFNRGD